MTLFQKTLQKLGARMELYAYGHSAPSGGGLCVLSPINQNTAVEQHTPHGTADSGMYSCICSAEVPLPSAADGYIVVGGHAYTLVRDEVISVSKIKYRRAVLTGRTPSPQTVTKSYRRNTPQRMVMA